MEARYECVGGVRDVRELQQSWTGGSQESWAEGLQGVAKHQEQVVE